jgi:hypothetical protein
MISPKLVHVLSMVMTHVLASKQARLVCQREGIDIFNATVDDVHVDCSLYFSTNIKWRTECT